MSHVLTEEAGTITVTPPVLIEIVVRAAESAEGTRVRRGRRHLDVVVADGRVNVVLELAARYGIVLPVLAREVQERVTEALTTMCGLVVETVDVSVEEVD